MIKKLNKLVAGLIIGIFSILVGCVVWQVISRYVLGAPSIATDEIARFLFMWVGLIGAAYAMGLKQHLAIDLLLMRQKGKRKIGLQLFILAVMLIFAVSVLIYSGMQLVIDTYLSGQVSPSLGISMGWVYLCLPLSGGIMLVYLVAEITHNLQQLTKLEGI
ncbi:TRAP transporter small permease [Muribacter muris]|uniref:TRAP transporter small permease protein n=1 Tax=Muribacter muris TaxID=67855 RepID=A0A4Y9JUV3_9PAST|nr:TRAP transporter small permease [Muribacter muris]MBF0785915.1 TRAP transporter small permease [Muribacter muris]MBF0827709.1 TRAP transporter small permease [Muribacter muris]TFV08265.1 TRAP transporter small permease [Muribacter muris]